MGRKLKNPSHPLQLWLDKEKVKKRVFAKKLGITSQYLDMFISCRLLPGRDLGFEIENLTNGAITPRMMKTVYDNFRYAA